MKRNSRLSVALHVLAHLAEAPQRCVTSEELATCVQTNPVVIRRTLGSLREAAIVTSTKGHGGGWALARAPESISVRDIYLALDATDLFNLQPALESPGCLIEATICHALDDFFRDAEALLVERLGRISLADLSSAFHRRLAEHQDLRHATGHSGD